MESIKIFVFSSTGTCLQAAKDIAENIEGSEIISIPKLMKQKKWSIEADTVGFVFPCYYGGMPQIVGEFLGKAERIKAGYVFAVAAAGNDFGYSMKMLDEELIKRGSRLNYGRQIIVASNYMAGWYYNMFYKDKEALNNNVKDAEAVCKKATEDIKNKVNHVLKPSFRGYFQARALTPHKYVESTKEYDREYSVSDECTHCGICAKVCPVGNIEVTGDAVIFSHNCQRCMACVQACPKSAFSINGNPMKKEKYIHPKMTFKELAEFN